MQRCSVSQLRLVATCGLRDARCGVPTWSVALLIANQCTLMESKIVVKPTASSRDEKVTKNMCCGCSVP